MMGLKAQNATLKENDAHLQLRSRLLNLDLSQPTIELHLPATVLRRYKYSDYYFNSGDRIPNVPLGLSMQYPIPYFLTVEYVDVPTRKQAQVTE